MRFGGHETFPVREGWLSRGLRTLRERPEVFEQEFPEDTLGVGRNMYKSIRHWLAATGLAIDESRGRGKPRRLTMTDFGELVSEQDPFFLETCTWWLLHCNLVNGEAQAKTWSWFFLHWKIPRFEKGACLTALERHLNGESKRVPQLRTLERDLGCLLASYSRKPRPSKWDPEDTSDCPFQELQLLTYHPSTGSYELRRELKPVTPGLFGYSVSRSESLDFEEGSTELSLQGWEKRPGGPGHCFLLDAEALHELAVGFERRWSDSGVSIQGLAGEKLIRVECRKPEEWAQQVYAEAREKEPVSHG